MQRKLAWGIIILWFSLGLLGVGWAMYKEPIIVLITLCVGSFLYALNVLLPR